MSKEAEILRNYYADNIYFMKRDVYEYMFWTSDHKLTPTEATELMSQGKRIGPYMCHSFRWNHDAQGNPPRRESTEKWLDQALKLENNQKQRGASLYLAKTDPMNGVKYG